MTTDIVIKHGYVVKLQHAQTHTNRDLYLKNKKETEDSLLLLCGPFSERVLLFRQEKNNGLLPL